MKIKAYTLRFKIMMLFSFLVVVLFFVISLVFYQGIDKVIRKTTENELRVIADETSNKIERFLFERYGDIRVLSVNPFLSGNSSFEDKKHFLDQIRNAYQTYDYLLLTDLQGKIILQSGSFSDQSLLNEIITQTKKNGIFVSDIMTENNGQGIIFSALTKNNKGQVTGIIVEKMNLKFIEQIVRKVTIGKKGFAYLINEDKIALFKKSPTRDLTDYHQKRKKRIEYFNFKGDNYIHVVSPVKRYPTQSRNWFIVVEDIENEAFGIIHQVWIFTLTVMFFSILTVLLFGWLISTVITYPVKRLVDQTALLAQGEKLENIKIDSKDEIGALASSLNIIINNLNMMVNQILETSGQAVSTKEIRDYFNRFSNDLSSGIITIDRKGQVDSINQAGYDLLNIETQAISQLNIYQSTHASFLPLAELFKDCLQNGAIYARHIVRIPVKEKETALIFSSSVQKDKSGHIIGVVGIFREMEEFLRFEQSVDRAKSLNSLGMMSAGIAHEIRNPLTSVKGYAQYIKSVLDKDHELQKDVEIIIYEVDRLNRIIDRFLYFARPKKPDFSLININQTIRQTVQLISRDKSDHSEFVMELTDLPDCLADHEQMEQVFLNLIINACQAAGIHGFVKIKSQFNQKSNFIEIDIEDNGQGIKAEDYDKIFEPFYTTKEKGTGLGLAITARIIEDHKGFIEYQSLPGQGTVFSLKIPLRNENEIL